MSFFASDTLSEHEAAAARDLFDRIVAAEADSLTDAQKADPRAYLLDAWEKAAEAVMRPIQPRRAIEEELQRYRDAAGKLDVPF